MTAATAAVLGSVTGLMSPSSAPAAPAPLPHARPLTVGPLTVWPPVVLAPMAGVTNVVYRSIAREFAAAAATPVTPAALAAPGSPSSLPGLFVSEMVSAKAVVLGDDKTWRQYLAFGEEETVRSLQLYGSDPADIGEAVRRVVGEAGVGHIDLNFGCPVPKVTRRGGGAAVPARPRLLAAIVRSAVAAASPAGVPVTMKFRTGIDDDLLTFLDAGRVGEEEGAAAIALHARTAAAGYDGPAMWERIAELKAAVRTIPVLGNGDLWESSDALAMVAATGCDGVVIGRGCLGRPWLFAELATAFAGAAVPAPPDFGTVRTVLDRHVRDLVAWRGNERGSVHEFRKHLSWYLKGYKLGVDVRGRLAAVSTLDELDGLLDALDPTATVDPLALRGARGKTGGRRKVPLPDGFLDNRDDDTPPGADRDDESDRDLVVSGG